MSERVVVHSVEANAEAGTEVARRLRDKGIEIIEQQPNMFLVSGDHQAVGDALGGARGWHVSPLTKTPPPSTRQRVLKPP
jgi:hypothetical protein